MTQERPAHRRMSAEDRQHQLLDVALAVFSRKGFKGATTKEIARAAGVTEAVIFQHFPSKEALYSAVLELNLGAWEQAQDAEEIRGYMARNDDEGLFRIFITRILNGYRNNAAFQRVVLFAALEGHEQGLNRLKQQFSPMYAQFLEYFERRQREGALAEGNPFAIWIGLGGIAHQYGLITRIMNVDIPGMHDETVADEFTQILMHGVKNRVPSPDKNQSSSRTAARHTRKAKELMSQR